MILAYYVYQKSSIRQSFIKYLFPKKIWASKSAVVDYSFFCFNSLIKIILIGPYIIVGFYIAFYINEFLLQLFGFPSNSLGVTQTIILYTITLTIVGDFFTYIVHNLMHRIPFLWEFHKVHHSATSLNPITQYRIHPFELIINNVRGIVVFGLVTGIFDYLSGHSIDKLLFLGANVFHFLFLLFGANLRHSHVKLKYPKLIEYIFISPFQHQIHHSVQPKHFNKNMGSKFAFWDYIFGTLVLSQSTSRIKFGIPKEDLKYNSFLGSLINPFLKPIFKISKYLKSIKRQKQK
jgi:sterol desaturase/sphingolipid hydroxylase (fatty acid hydroxylase superfamily)